MQKEKSHKDLDLVKIHLGKKNLRIKFPYQETDDQLRCIEEVKKDMESPKPMDRLLCGDVGYGKTEVAMRVGI